LAGPFRKAARIKPLGLGLGWLAVSTSTTCALICAQTVYRLQYSGLMIIGRRHARSH
jgi:hypothetical protein